MSNTIPGFVYEDFTDRSRAAMLAATTDPDKLIQTLATNITALVASSLTYHWSTSRQQENYGRVEFTIPIGHDLFDKFFNSPAGIRGQFFGSVQAGQAFQTNLREQIKSTLANYVTNNDPTHTKQAIESIVGTYSKFWMDEDEGLPGSSDQTFPIAQWVNSPNNASITGKLHTTQAHANVLSAWGVWAPVRFNLIFLGTFVDGQGHSWLPDSKKHRGGQISYFGFS